MKKQTIYNDAFSKMHRILSAYGLSGEMRNFGRMHSYDIRMHDAIVGSLCIDTIDGAPFISLSGGVIIPLFHCDGRKASIENALRRFEDACSMIVNDFNYMDIANNIFKDIKENGR